MDITCKFTATKNDVYSASKAYYSRSWRRWVWWPIGTISLVIGLALVSQGKSLGTGLFLLLYGVFVFLIPVVNAQFVTRSFFSNKNLGGPMEYRMTEEGLHSHSSAGTSDIEWKTFARWAETEDAFLLIIYRNYFVIVLKKGFEGEEQVSQFREFLASRIGKRTF